MRKSPIAKGREKAVKRVITVLERERRAAQKAMMNVSRTHSERDEISIIACARYMETAGIQEALTKDLKQYLGTIGKKTTPDAATSDTAVQPPATS